jgi:carotenoid phi-ring synthase / carotenoid chi-ring synthase
MRLDKDEAGRMKAENQVIIIGAGVAGLTAALHLAERGLRPLVLEADPDRPGGRLKGGVPVEFEHAGQTWCFGTEHGVHGIWSPYRNLQAMLARHLIRPVFIPAQEEEWIMGLGRWVRRAQMGSAIRDSWVPAPFHYLGLFARPRFWAMLTLPDILSMFPLLAGLLSMLSIDPLGEEQPLSGMTMADFCRGWAPTLVDFFAGLTRNAMSARVNEIPASGFVAFLRFYTLLRRDAWAFSYLPVNGGGSIVEPMVNVLRAFGGEVDTGAKVMQLTLAKALPSFASVSEAGWRVEWQQNGEPRSAETAHVILATDAPAAEALLRASPDTAEQAARLRLPVGRPTAIVRLWFDRAPQSLHAEAGIFTGDFCLDNFFWLHRIYDEYVRWSRATGGCAIESHIYGPAELLAEPDAALLTRAILDVGRAWPELKGHLIHSALARNEATHTLLHVGVPDEHLGVETPWPHLYCCGDWVRDRNPAMFLERACVTGIKAANAVLNDLALEPWPLLSYPQPEAVARRVEAFMRGVRRAMRRSKR